MSNHTDHTHVHGADCEHKTVAHDGHHDFLHDGHLHHVSADGAIEEHSMCVCDEHPEVCTPEHACGDHAADHVHAADCGHAVVPHGDHVDYLVNGHLHHPHGGHCDHHGRIAA